MFSITVPARILRASDVFPRFVPNPARPDVGHYADAIRTGDLVHVGPNRDVAIFVGISPAGVAWVTTDANKLEPQRQVLARIWSRTTRHIIATAVVEGLA